MFNRAVIALVCTLGLAGSVIAPAVAQQAPEKKHDPFPGWNQRVAQTSLDFRRYYTLEEVDQTCRMLAERFPEMLAMREIGRSLQGRPIYVLTLNAASTGPHDSKPAMYIDSNIHGNEIQGTEIILVTLWYLLRHYGHEPWVTRLVDTRSFYFVPVINPDARHAWFATASTPHRLRGNFRPFDDDRDGRFDEDPPNDLNGDGRITMMRKLDPLGDWVLARDRRIMERRKPGEPGQYRVWRTEGLDDDGDGEIDEDDIGGVDLNRNFPAGWQPRHRQRGAGEFPCSEPEVRACVDFLLAHPNIAGMQFYHNAARMILRPPGMSSDAGLVPREDITVYDRLGRRGERIIPGYRYLQTHDGLYQAFGTQIDFGYLGLGRFVFTNELWGSTGHEIDGLPGISQEDMRDWYEEFGLGRSWIEWQPFNHPQLGEIEIGGWDQFATRMPPAELFIEEGFRNALFTLKHAESFAELEFVRLQTSDAGDGLTRVRLGIRNRGAMPTDSAMAAQRRQDTPVRVSVNGAELLSAATADQDFVNTRLQRGRNDALLVPRIAPDSIVWAELILRVPAGAAVTLHATHPRAVNASATLP